MHKLEALNMTVGVSRLIPCSGSRLIAPPGVQGCSNCQDVVSYTVVLGAVPGNFQDSHRVSRLGVSRREFGLLGLVGVGRAFPCVCDVRSALRRLPLFPSRSSCRAVTQVFTCVVRAIAEG
eukprot:5106228-Pyramimonas_sp.AAC.1